MSKVHLCELKREKDSSGEGKGGKNLAANQHASEDGGVNVDGGAGKYKRGIAGGGEKAQKFSIGWIGFLVKRGY